jgi:hyperosmotically inducible protein
MTHRFRRLVAVSALFLSLASCSVFQGRENADQYTDDASVTARVKSAFVEDKYVSAMQINVETMKGVVQLSGFADSQATEARAVRIANNIDGVKMVKDDIAISH